jgi:hypothetical protein
VVRGVEVYSEAAIYGDQISAASSWPAIIGAANESDGECAYGRLPRGCIRDEFPSRREGPPVKRFSFIRGSACGLPYAIGNKKREHY